MQPTRRSYSKSFKAQVIQERVQPGASIASVALRHSLNANLVDTDIAAIEAELQTLQIAPVATETKQKPKRTALPPEFPRTLIHHEPDHTHCPCGCVLKRIGEDVSERLEYTQGVFTVERHSRGKLVCDDFG